MSLRTGKTTRRRRRINRSLQNRLTASRGAELEMDVAYWNSKKLRKENQDRHTNNIDIRDKVKEHEERIGQTEGRLSMA